MPSICQSNLHGFYQPVAIVGLSCRFPGAKDKKDYWQILRDGRDARSAIPKERFCVDEYYANERNENGTTNVKHGYFLSQIDSFDAEFFGISPREALSMDPQQRLMLELTWEAFEDAHLPGEIFHGSKTGVFFGVIWNDYQTLWHRASPKHITHHTLTGSHFSMIANRVSYTFDLRGPSIALDTSCSSSLVAIHAACNSLRLGECTMALAGGVNLIVAPDSFIAMSQFGATAADGRSKAFAADADGYGRGEGGGVVVLKRLSDAIRAGDHIYCVIRGGAVSNDGRGLGVGIPHHQSQVELINEAHRNASVTAASISYVEAHGTGTAVGDPIEARALGETYAKGRLPDEPLLIGSVKTNIGHLEASAGVASVIKVALALKHKELPPSLNCNRQNPAIDFFSWRLKVSDRLMPWPSKGNGRRAGVTGLGFGGTNCHLILEEWCEAPLETQELLKNTHSPLVLSAASPTALWQMARQTAEFLTQSADSIYELAATRALHHTHLPHRLFLFPQSTKDAHQALETFAQHGSSHRHIEGSVAADFSNKRVFVFPGQGNQWPGMGLGLFRREAIFRESINKFDDAMANMPPEVRPKWTIRQKLEEYNTSKTLEAVNEVQPVLCAIQIALAELWIAHGIEPDAIIGHSMGEVAGAYIAQILSLKDAVRIICTRSHLASLHASGIGAMALVELSQAEAETMIAATDGRVSIAAINGPSSIVVSGERSALSKIVDDLEKRQVFQRLVRVDFASHCPLVEPMLPDLLAQLKDIESHEPTVDFYSTVLGQKANKVLFDAEYWCKNIRQPVLFSPAVACTLSELRPAFIEISPHPSLLNSVESIADACKIQTLGVPSMRRDNDEADVFLHSLGTLYVHGHQPNWNKLFPRAHACKKLALPNYPWQRKRFWPDNIFNQALKHIGTPESDASGAEHSHEAHHEARDRVNETSTRQTLREKIASILMMPSIEIEDTRPLNQLGLDSMMAGQLRRFIEKQFGVSISVIQILKGMSLEQFEQKIAHETSAEVDSSVGVDVKNLSEEQVNDLLRRMLKAEPTHGET